jgi:hypothetical protein
MQNRKMSSLLFTKQRRLCSFREIFKRCDGRLHSGQVTALRSGATLEALLVSSELMAF